MAKMGWSPSYGIPTLLILCIGLCIAGLVLGIYDYPGNTLLLAGILPMVLWPYAMILVHVTRVDPSWSTLLIVLGLVPLLLAVAPARLLGGTKAPAADRQIPAQEPPARASSAR